MKLHLHKWKEYEDIKSHAFYRICSVCGKVQQYLGPECEYVSVTDCRTNNWKLQPVADLIRAEEEYKRNKKIGRLLGFSTDKE